MIFARLDERTLNRLVFRGDYPGYRPEVIEAPDGDGRLDTHKRYAHIATKYIAKDQDVWRAGALTHYLRTAFDHALAVAERLGVPAAYRPVLDACALRVLEYPAGVGGEPHTDFDLFTTLCYRDDPTGLVREYSDNGMCGRADILDAFDPGLHIGEIGELVGLGPATPHYVRALDKPQHSIVFFALPSHDAVLPSGRVGPDYVGPIGITVGAWLAERMSRSRVPATQTGGAR